MLLDGRMPIPRTFGAFHLISIIAVIALCALVIRKRELFNEKRIPYVLLAVGAVMTVLEIYKQLIHGFYIEDGVFHWDYPWYIFPFQFCSSPLYIFPIIAFTKNEKLRDACIAYMMTFSLFAGLAVFAYPGDVFIETAGICLQTMVHHGSQVILGVLYAVRYRDRFGVKHFFSGESKKCYCINNFVFIVHVFNNRI
jgi:hypothetical protein